MTDRAADTDETDDTAEARHPRFRNRPALRDALFALLFMFPAAAIVALVYRFPVPFGGYARGPAGVWDAMLATLFFGLVGGFVLVPLLAGGASTFLRRRSGDRASRIVPFVPLAAALLYAIVLAIL